MVHMPRSGEQSELGFQETRYRVGGSRVYEARSVALLHEMVGLTPDNYTVQTGSSLLVPDNSVVLACAGGDCSVGAFKVRNRWQAIHTLGESLDDEQLAMARAASAGIFLGSWVFGHDMTSINSRVTVLRAPGPDRDANLAVVTAKLSGYPRGIYIFWGTQWE
jgi:hypothetical protein